MKNYLVFILILITFACTHQSGFTIKVSLKGAKGKALLEEYNRGRWTSIDTADFVKGTAVLEGEIPRPGVYYLSVIGQQEKSVIFVENTKMTVTGEVGSLNSVKVTGSGTHDEYEKINSKINDVTKKYMKLYEEGQKANVLGDTIKGREQLDQVKKLYDSIGTMQEEFIKANPTSFVTPYFLSNLQYGKEVEELEEIVNGLDEKLQSVQMIIDLKERILKMKAVAIGKIAPDFIQNNVDGIPLRFSEVYSKNEITLIDFWASWAVPCREENPNIVAVFNDYKNLGFGVIGISLDKEKDKWIKAIEDDNLDWIQVSDLAFWGNGVAQLYAVNSIPFNLLVDRTGMIIAKNKQGDELREFIAGLLN